MGISSSTGALPSSTKGLYACPAAGHAHPFCAINYKRRLKDVNFYLDSTLRLTSIGRTGGFKYVDIDQCIEDATIFSRLV